MNAEREMIKRLWESRDCDNEELDERTYTVGDTQYWKRGGKTYKWTSSGGKSECSEDEYMKAISGGSDNSSGNSGAVKNTDAKDDKSKDSSKPKKDSPYSKYGFTKRPTENKVGRITDKYIQGDEARDITYVLTNRDGKIANIVNHDKQYGNKPGTYEGSVDRLLKDPDARSYYQKQLDAGIKKVQETGTDEEKNMINYINDKWKEYLKNNPIDK